MGTLVSYNANLVCLLLQNYCPEEIFYLTVGEILPDLTPADLATSLGEDNVQQLPYEEV